MGIDLTSFIDLSVSVESPGVTKPGLLTPLIYSYSTVIPASEVVREYSTTTVQTDMAADGFVASDPAFIAASIIASQNPKPASIKVCRSTSALADHDVDLEVQTFATGETLTVTIYGEDPAAAGEMTSETYERTCGGASLIAEAAALAVLITNGIWGAAGDITAITDGVDTVEIRGQPGFANKILYYDLVTNIVIDDVTAARATAVGTDLTNNIVPFDADWYMLVPADAGTIDATAASTWANAETNKTCMVQSQDSDIYGGTGLMADLLALNHEQSVGIFSKRRLSLMPGAAYAGLILASEPGTSNNSFKALTGVAASEYTNAQANAIFADQGNIYSGIDIAGVDVTTGTVLQGFNLGTSKWFDLIHLRDAMVVEVQVEILSMQIASKKISFNDKGIGQIQAAFLRAIRRFEGEDKGFDIGSAFCNVPTAASVAAADKANRLLRGVSFGATANGAIIKVVAVGTISV